MKVEIMRGRIKDKSKNAALEKTTIEFDGSTIFPFYIDVLSIRVEHDKISINMLGEYETRISPTYDEKNGKSDDRLWIMGKGRIPGLEDEARLM